MEKLINIDGKEVRLATNASTPMKFKRQFQKDFFGEVIKMSKLFEGVKDIADLSISEIDELDFDTLYNIMWSFAKTADKNVLPPEEWLETFDEFPVFEIFGECSELIEGLMSRRKKQ